MLTKAKRALLGDVSTMRTDHPNLWYFMRAFGRFARLRDFGIAVSRRVAGDPESNGAITTNGAPTLFPDLAGDEIVSSLRRDGYSPGVTLPGEAVEEILDFAQRTPVYVNKDRDVVTPLADVDRLEEERGIKPVAGEYLDALDCGMIARLARDPVLVSIAKDYLGFSPRFHSARLWWSFPNEASEAEHAKVAQRFHTDIDDFRFVKYFFYLTDVDEGAGPHVVVKGTHTGKRFWHQARVRRYSDEEILGAYGPEAVTTVCMPAGGGFAEDPYCLHKGQSPTESRRLLLYLAYGFNDFERV
jgi:hypothetical protein